MVQHAECNQAEQSWTIAPGADGISKLIVSGDEESWEIVAKVYFPDKAPLIAAAPDMLAVLESVYVDLVDYSKRLSGAYSTGSIALSSCADQVHAVIQKAKGG